MAKKRKIERRGGARKNAGRKAILPVIAPLEDRIHIAELCRQHAHTCVEKLLHLMAFAESEDVQKTSAIYMLNRGYGTPPQTVDLGNKNDDAFKVESSFNDFKQVLDNIAKLKGSKIDE